MSLKQFVVRLQFAALSAALVAMTGTAASAPLAITDAPLFLNSVVPPLNMLVVGRDHKLFYEAYSDHSDLTGDGNLDVDYQGARIDYFGYFDSYKCYTHDGTRFVPASVTANKKCSLQWSGDWLNWATTARIDAMRKVLYGGKRFTDSGSDTVLERTIIPQDAHSWGKEYTDYATNRYYINEVTPYPMPTPGTRHFFANTTLMTTTDWTTNNSNPPLLRVLLNQAAPRRIWNWVSKESPVAGGSIDTGAGNVAVAPTDLPVRVQVCVPSMRETNCKQYPSGNWKPTGLLQDFGENDTMLFGLLTGSYQKSKSGGVLRKQMGTIKDEINWNSDGTLNSTVGIIRTMDLLRPAGYTNYTTQAGGYGTVYQPGLVTTRPFNEGEFGGDWGNPVGEMMYEALRYFAGKAGPTSNFDYSGTSFDSTMGLPKVNSWTNPYGAGKPVCAKPFETVVSDVNTSYDSDSLPGSYFNGFTGDLAGLNVSTEGDRVWAGEFGATGKYFTGQSGALYDGAPTPKDVSSFASIRGLAPEEPTKEGTYYSASVARFGLLNDLNGASGNQKAQTFAIALASPLPRIEIPVGTGRFITLVPFAKSVGGASINAAAGSFQPTNQIVDFYVEFIAADRKSGSFQVNFEDVEAGNDHDMDAISRYTYVVNADNSVTITMSSDYAAGGIIQHMGYVISGSTKDGIYLEVRDKDTAAASDVDYFLDTPDLFTGTPPAPNLGVGRWNDAQALPLLHSRTFTPGPTTAANVLKDPLWYAAKWGGFEDSNGNGMPDIASEWDTNGDGNPDNYFLVTNALKLKDQLSAAFNEIIRRTGSASSASVNTGSISSDTRVYQAKFNSGEWSGQLLSYPVNITDGTLLAAEWDARDKLAAQTPTSRVILTKNANTNAGVAFRWTDIGATHQGELQPSDTRGSNRLDYLRGDSALETTNTGGIFRPRVSKLGDIVSSSPTYVGKPPMGYPDSLETAPYSAFAAANANRQKMVYVGANDGMLHGFDAGTNPATFGQEKIAYVPSAVFPNLIELTKPNYSHRFYVDGTPTVGDAFYNGAWHTILLGSLNKGGKSIFALDITNPSAFNETNASTILRWEFTDADLGLTYSRPVIAKLHDGKWYAVFGNGYNNTQGAAPVSSNGRASLFFVNLETGAKTRQIITAVASNPGTPTTPNGLATPALVDADRDNVVDFAYAGDLLGNMWKFDLRSTNPSSWNVAYGGLPLFVAKDSLGNRQPITERPEIGRGPKGNGFVVLVGTGKFLELADKTPTQRQSFYGVYDANTMFTSDVLPATMRSVLTQQTILAEQNFTFTTSSGPVTLPMRVTSANSIGTNRGWYMDFLSPPATYRGEMQVSNPVLRNGRVIFTTLVPDADPCSGGGTSWLMEMDALTGSRLNESPFDSNGDGIFSEADMVTINVGGVDITVPVSALQSEVGIAQAPGILFTPGTPGVPPGPGGPGSPPLPPMEYKYLSGSAPNASGSTLHRVKENPGVNSKNRQSWRQLK